MPARGRSRIKQREKGDVTVQVRLARLEAMMREYPIETHPSPTSELSLLSCHNAGTGQQPDSASGTDQSLPDAYALSSSRLSELASADHQGFTDSASYSNSIPSVSLMNACATVERERGGSALSPLSAKSNYFVNPDGLPQMFNLPSDMGLSSSTTVENRPGIPPACVAEEKTVHEESIADEGSHFNYELVSVARASKARNLQNG